MKAKLIPSARALEGETITSLEQLREALVRLAEEKQQVLELRLDSGPILTLGVGSSGGFVQFTNKRGEPPYFIAKQPNAQPDSGSYLEFDSGGTPTPIGFEYCLEMPLIISLAEYFIKYHTPSPIVDWVEV